MNKNWKQGGLCRAVALASAFLWAGCASTGDRRWAGWPEPVGGGLWASVWHDYQPAPLGSAEAAIGTIKNLEPQFCTMEGYKDKTVDVDRFGLRVKAYSVESEAETTYVPSYGGFWAGGRYVPTYGGSYVTQTRERPVSESAIIPFPQVRAMEIYHLPGLNREFQWLLRIHIEDSLPVQFRAVSKTVAEQLANAIATLAREHRPLSQPRWGLRLADLSGEVSRREGLEGGAAVQGVAVGSAAERAGLRYRDVIVRINDIEVKSAAEALNWLSETPPEPGIVFAVRRWDGNAHSAAGPKGAWVEILLRTGATAAH